MSDLDWKSVAEAATASAERMEAALRPFADYAAKDGFGLNYEGKPIPDGEGVGWIYLTVGDFRRAAAALACAPAPVQCSDCPPDGHPTDKTRCDDCPRKPAPVQGDGEGWRSDMEAAPKDGTRLLLLWRVDGLPDHVELGKWSTLLGRWCNTYGKAFSGTPDAWAPLAPFTPITNGGENE